MADQSRDPQAQANFAKLQEELAQLRASEQAVQAGLEAQSAEIRALGGELSSPKIIQGGAAGGRAGAVLGESGSEIAALQRAINEVTAALEKGDAALEQQLAAERQLVAAASDRLAVETAVSREQAAQATSKQLIIPTGAASYGPRSATAGGQIEAEAAAAQAAAQAQAAAAEAAAQAAALEARAGRATLLTPAARTPGITEGVYVPPPQPQPQPPVGAGVASIGTRPVTPPGPAAGGPGAGVASVGVRQPIKLSDVSQFTAAEQVLIDKAKQIPPAERSVTTAMESANRTLSASSLAYRQHGALTTEFIAAAAKGQVTIKELGDQMLLTIGKFAGWTAAAAATYGVIGALGGIARGATDAASGVEQLNRFIDNVNTSKAQEQFRSLSATNNVSIKDAADATAAFAKIFQNQDEAVKAADVALKATQLDQISLADSTRFLTGAIIGFRLPASQLPLIFDQINNAQRRFGASVAQTLAALGGSAAAVHNAGGDFNDYIALVTAAQRATAQTGSVIGTAFRRSATSFVTKPTNQAILRSFGLDPTEAYTQLLLDAVKKAKNLSGPQINQLAQGLGGPQQGARVFAGLLQRSDLVAKALDVTAPAKASGSAAQEMAHKLAQADQQIKAVAFSMERLGSALAQSGALTPFLALAKGFGGVLDVVSHLLDAVDKLPGGIGQVLIPLAEVTAAFRLLRNLDFGSRLSPSNPLAGLLGSSASGGAGLLRPSANRSAQKDFEKGFDEQRTFYEQLRQGSAQTGARLAAQVRFQEAYIGSLNAVGAEDALLLPEARRLESLQAQQTRAIAEQEFYRGAILELDEQNNARLAAIRSGVAADSAALQAGFTQRVGTVERPTTVVPPVALGRPSGVVQRSSGLLVPAGGTAPPEAVVTNVANASQIGVGTALLARWTAAKQRLAQVLGADAVASSAASGAVAAEDASLAEATVASTSAAAKIGLGAASLNTFRAGSAAVTGVISKLAGGLTSTAGLLIGVPIAIGEVTQAIDKVNSEAQDTKSLLTPLATSVAQFKDTAFQLQQKAASQAANENRGGLGGVFGDVFGPFLSSFEQTFLGVGEQSPRTQALANLAHGYVALLKQAQNDAGLVREGSIGRQAWFRKIKELRALAESNTPAGADAHKLLAGFNSALNSLAGQLQKTFTLLDPKNKDPFAQFKGVDPKAIAAQIQAEADRAKLFGATPETFRKIAFAYTELARRFAGSHNDTDLQLVSQAQQSFIDAARTDAENLVNEAATASTKAEKNSLYAQARQILDQARRQGQVATDALRGGIKADAAAYQTALREMAAINKAVDSASSQIERDVLAVALGQNRMAAVVAGAFQKLSRARKTLDQVSNAEAQNTAQLDAELKSINSAQKTANKQTKTPSSESAFSLDRLRRELQAARDQGNDVQVARDSQALARDEIAAAKNRHDALQGQIDLANADNQLAQALEANAQAWFSYREALTQDPVKQAEIAYQAALEAVAAAVRQGGADSTAAVTARAAAAQAQQTIAKAIEDRRQSLFTLRESLTQDPVKQALIELRKDEQNAAFINKTEGPNTADARNARAAVNDQKNKLRATRLQASEDTIQFDLDMGKITQETAVREYEALLKMHGITLAARRQIKEAIHQLQTGSGLDSDLNLGSIRLPTAYEIRRAYLAAVSGGGKSGTGIQVNQRYSTTIQVTDERGAHRVGQVFDKYHRGTGKAIARAMQRR